MIVYCEVKDCAHNDNGYCANKWPIGTEAIKIRYSVFFGPICGDFKDKWLQSPADGGDGDG